MKNLMKNMLVLFLALVLVTGMQPVAAAAPQAGNKVSAIDAYKELAAHKISLAAVPDGAAAKDGQVIIKLKSGCKLDWQGQGLKLLDTPASAKKRGIYLATVAPGRDVSSEVRRLASLPEVEYAQPNYAYKVDIQPNDELYAQQWGLDKIDVPEAWNITQGSPSVGIAVLDTGVDASHPDLQGRVLPGYDFVNGDDDPSDDNGHGTMVAGVIAAVANNGIGIAGVDKKCKILPVKVAGADGNFYSSDIINGIYYAVDRGADVINMSFGGQTDAAYDQAIADALWDAYNAGIVLVAASGNDSGAVSFPAALPPVISVGATDKNDNIAEFSNYGPELDLVAPGVDIYTTYGDGMKEGYASANGTSLAAPFVSGIAALILAKNPKLKPNQVEYMIEASAIKPSHMGGVEWDQHFGYGRADAYAALNQSLPDMSADVSDEWQQAELIRKDEVIRQFIDIPMDADWYKVDVISSGSVDVKINVPEDIDIAALVYSSGASGMTKIKAVNAARLGENETFSFTAQPGTYYIQVFDANFRWSVQPYSIAVSGPVEAAPLSNAGIVSTASDDMYISSFYAISSYSEKDYAAYSDQVALGWSEIRQDSQGVYFSQYKKENGRAFDYGVPEGDVEGLVRGMKVSGAKLMLSVFLQDAAITDKLLGSPQAIDGVVAQMTRDWGIKYYNYNDGTSAYVLDDSGRVVEYDGIIVDFEGLTAEDKEGFNAFLDKLRDAMPAGKTLGVCVQPKRKPGIAYYDGYDYANIGKVADQVILMAHDYQKDRASTPASAPYDLVKEAVEFAISEIPPQKILLQVSLAPVQWTKGKGTYNFTTLDAMQKALDGQVPGQKVLYATPKDERYDPVYRTGWAYLKRQLADGTVQEDDFYFENVRSLQEKMSLIESYGLKGMSVWRLGLGTPEVMDSIYILPDARLGGADRYKTAVAISRRGWPDGSQAAVLACGTKFPDGLAGGPLAKALNAPLLLTETSRLNADTEVELKRLKVKTVYILGTADVVSQAVEDRLKALGYTVKRLGGDTRFDTAVKIAEEIKTINGYIDKVILARGDDYADALAAGATGYPILFASWSPSDGTLHGSTAKALIDLGVKNVDIIGQSDVVPAAIEDKVKAMGIAVNRIGGDDRELTSLEVAESYMPYAKGAVIATGRNFPDALAAGPLAAKWGYPVLLAKRNSVKPNILAFIKGSAVKNSIFIAGENDVVSDDVAVSAINAATFN